MIPRGDNEVELTHVCKATSGHECAHLLGYSSDSQHNPYTFHLMILIHPSKVVHVFCTNLFDILNYFHTFLFIR